MPLAVNPVVPAVIGLMGAACLWLVLVPMNSAALSGIQPRDAGVASAMVNTTQQMGGALETALLNSLYASAVAGCLTSNYPGAAGSQAFQLDGYLHGYRIAFLVASPPPKCCCPAVLPGVGAISPVG